MKKISKVKRCLRYEGNARGRDLLVGDLHGHRSLLEDELAGLDFDPSRDRVFSVGDLVDRGPESLETLALLEEPWFHAVLGNHELMLLGHLGYYESRLHATRLAAKGGGDWVAEALSRNRKTMSRLADLVASLPLAIHVDGDAGAFNVVHGDLFAIGSSQEQLFVEESICIHKADRVTTSRDNFNAASKSCLLDLQFGRHTVQVSDTLFGALPITYVGHTRARHVTVHDSYVYIDQGVCLRTIKRVAPTPPTVLDHRKFAGWLAGVASARGARPEAPGGGAALDSSRALATA